MAPCCGGRAQLQSGMYFKREANLDYLVRTAPNNSQKCLGRRSAETEERLARFTHEKRELVIRERSLRDAVQEASRSNKALRMGQAPEALIRVLKAIDQADWGERYVVVGDAALYAYQAAASVLRRSVDLRPKPELTLLETEKTSNSDPMTVLQTAAKGFRWTTHEPAVAVNETSAYRVQLLEVARSRRQMACDARWVISEGLCEPALHEVIEQVIVFRNGRMAMMRALTPKCFIDQRVWRAHGVARRPKAPRDLDARQVALVQLLFREHLPHLR